MVQFESQDPTRGWDEIRDISKSLHSPPCPSPSPSVVFTAWKWESIATPLTCVQMEIKFVHLPVETRLTCAIRAVVSFYRKRLHNRNFIQSAERQLMARFGREILRPRNFNLCSIYCSSRTWRKITCHRFSVTMVRIDEVVGNLCLVILVIILRLEESKQVANFECSTSQHCPSRQNLSNAVVQLSMDHQMSINFHSHEINEPTISPMKYFFSPRDKITWL